LSLAIDFFHLSQRIWWVENQKVGLNAFVSQHEKEIERVYVKFCRRIRVQIVCVGRPPLIYAGTVTGLIPEGFMFATYLAALLGIIVAKVGSWIDLAG
jgi:hypothetical protein